MNGNRNTASLQAAGLAELIMPPTVPGTAQQPLVAA